MNSIVNFLYNLNDLIWSIFVLVPLLIFVSLYFSIKTKGAQFILLPNTLKRLSKSHNTDDKTSISSFQAFAIGLASRIGTGNLAGVAIALVTGGPGSIFWMWIISLFGAVNSLVESTLAQLYKVRSKEVSYRGGPAYYMTYALKRKKMAIVFAVIIMSIYGLSVIALQANTISHATINQLEIYSDFNQQLGYIIIGLLVATFAGYIIFGGAKRVANFSTTIVSVMAIVYLSMSFLIILLNIGQLPSIFNLIISSAFSANAVAGGTLGTVVSTGFKRGLFSNEAGMGTTPNAAAAANTKHPATQGSIQALGVFIDTIVICSATAAIILISGVPLVGDDGIKITQAAIAITLGDWATVILTISVFFFAFTTILGIYYYAQTNYEFLFPSTKGLKFYKSLIIIAIFLGSILGSSFVWMLGDLGTGLLAITNLIAIVPLFKYANIVITDYKNQIKKGIEEPIFDSREFEEFKHLDIWHFDKEIKKK